MPLPGEGPTSNPALSLIARLFRCVAGPLVVALLVTGCSAFTPIAPPKPKAQEFSLDAAKSAINQAKAAEEAGNWDKATEYYREAAARWPVYQDAWSGLARTAMKRGDGQTLALARFFEDRVVDSDSMHPRQARMTYVNAEKTPPKDIPAVAEWSKRMVAFFEYKDAYIQREAFDSRTKRSAVERYAIYPVAVGSVTAGVFSLWTVFSDVGGGSSSD
ncbi:tetratricopeptide repeat protein [Rhodospirillum sp. A1_3_36]|uniref:tetratricopeptide repeat protein n=1 Tax=Rhodospirillum sp. A1_3_36 TaxID=3391666 RepID=UPI0039A406DF